MTRRQGSRGYRGRVPHRPVGGAVRSVAQEGSPIPVGVRRIPRGRCHAVGRAAVSQCARHVAAPRRKTTHLAAMPPRAVMCAHAGCAGRESAETESVALRASCTTGERGAEGLEQGGRRTRRRRAPWSDERSTQGVATRTLEDCVVAAILSFSRGHHERVHGGGGAGAADRRGVLWRMVPRRARCVCAPPGLR